MGPVLIVGAGAMGAWLAVRLSRGTTVPVHLLARPDRRRALGATLQVEVLPQADPAGQGAILEASERLDIHSDPRGLPARPQLAIVAVRAYQTRDAASILLDAGIDPEAVLTLQNGLGNADGLAAAFGADRIVAGTTTHGVTFEPPARIVHAGAGDTVLGPWTSAALPHAVHAARLLEEAGIQIERVDDPRRALWLKVAVNTAINPATAIHRIENGRLLDDGPLEAALEEAAREAARVARAEGVALTDEEAVAAARRVATRTAMNRSSMLQALLAGRPLETGAITGEVVRRAARHGVPVPVNAAHLKAIEALTRTTPGQP